MPPNYVAPPAKLRRVFIQIRCRGCGQKGHNRATCDRQNNETKRLMHLQLKWSKVLLHNQVIPQ
ncbi:uncharacterized protein Pyn_21254 [Prunus yedoensis var. nudiflora]|uniref:CCHC-type domain-containing protein n=1 Tax=Prunus yedoensis var. nudiflora TaxID=2094558 RepID=A0A314XL85_PRUYE|nr:uncharacterized protein Pyn_21254 [Prunus yedoensis var. nudiflora]